MKNTFSPEEIHSIQTILTLLENGELTQGLDALRTLKQEIHAAIPERQRQSRGITWVVQQIAQLITAECGRPEQIRDIADLLDKNLRTDDLLMGIPIFLMAEYGKTHPQDVLDYFTRMGSSEDWIVREFAAAGVRRFIKPCRDVILPWFEKLARGDQSRLRRMVSEALRPVTENHWLREEPETSLDILRILFREADPYPRTSVGNNLSDLAHYHPDRILEIVQELVASGDENSYWIAYRACRNMVKKEPERIMDVLKVDEYHYKDRHFYRKK